MTTTTLTLTDFLLARIAEDEGRARAALGLLGIETEWHRVEWLRERGLTIGDAQHMTRHAPRRVLAECEAKRKIVEQVERNMRDVPAGWTARILEHLASVYADHPDYREEWRP